MGLFSWLGKGKQVFKPSPHQTLEIEFVDGEGEVQSYFVEVLEVAKKRLTLSAPGNAMNPVHIHPGLELSISYFDEGQNTFFSYESQVRDARDQEFDVDPPTSKTTDATEVPERDDGFRVNVSIPVSYQAQRSSYTQVASTHAITPNSLFLKTNLAIPPETSLKIVLEIPNAPHIDVNARAVGSEKDPEDNRKHISEVQFEEINPEDRSAILSYSIYYQKRQDRAESRSGGI